MSDVAIVGGGPTGVMLACELRLQGVQVAVLEKDAALLPVVRALGLHARSVEILDQRGLLERFLPLGQRHPLGGFFAGIPKPTPPGLDTAHPYVLGIGFPGEASTSDTLLGEVELTMPPEELNAIVAEVRQTYKNFGAGPLGDGVYRVNAPADGVAEDRTTPPTWRS